MKKSSISLARLKDERLVELVKKAAHKTLAIWAIDCAERVLAYFKEKYPEDNRPRTAIETLRTWINTDVFRMAVIRKASLNAHAAAREVGEDNAARSAARAAGQAVATAHVPTHSLGSAVYALQAISRATAPSEADTAVAKERDWQYQRLLELTGNMLGARTPKAYRATSRNRACRTSCEAYPANQSQAGQDS
jgi:Imm-5 like putative immunity protein